MIKKVAQELLTQQDIICLVYNGMDNVFQEQVAENGRSNNCKTPCHYKNKKENCGGGWANRVYQISDR